MFGDANHRVDEIKKKIEKLDERDDDNCQDEQGINERKTLIVDFTKPKLNLRQWCDKKAKSNWIKKGDLNTNKCTKWGDGGGTMV